MRAKIRTKLHAAHTGIQSTICYARTSVYWPGINAELKDLLSKCDTCNSFVRNQPKEPLVKYEIPERPWQKLGCDILTLDGEGYLVTVDYYSDYFEWTSYMARKTLQLLTLV